MPFAPRSPENRLQSLKRRAIYNAAMPKTRKPKAPQKKAQQSQPAKSDKKMVGYFEDRDIAERIHRELKKQGRETTEVLREAYRASVNGKAAADEWTIKESTLARRVNLNKETIARMRRAGKLKDAAGPLWKQQGSNFLYDVKRTREFFLGSEGAALIEEASQD